MHATVLVDASTGVSAETRPPTTALARTRPAHEDAVADTHALGETIASLAAGIHVATYRLLVLLREFDERLGWNTGFLSCAHWLHWRTGIDLGASREKVRVARALVELPRIAWAMEHGQLSYAKVRALTRVAAPENQAALLDVALCATAAQVERFVRGWRRVDRAAEAQVDERRHLNRELRTWVDDDGMVVIRGRLTPEAGAVVLRALEAAADRLFQDARSSPTAQTLTEEVTPGQRRADALALVAEAALSADLDRGTASDRYQVVLHVEVATASTSPAVARMMTLGDGTLGPEAGSGGVLELDHGAERVSAETSRRMSCDAAVVTIRHDVDSGVVDATHLDNLVLLCRRHHRAVHEGGFDVAAGDGGVLDFWAPDGAPLRQVPPAGRDPLETPAMDPPAPWDGTRLDLAYAIDVMWRPPPGR